VIGVGGLRAFESALRAGCEAPHGAVAGFDPYPGGVDAHDAPLGVDIDAVRACGYAPHAAAPELVSKAFKHAFGTTLVPRFGEPMAVSLKHGLVMTPANQSRWRAIETNIGKMREYFDLFFYRVQNATADKRRIVIVFGDALPVVIDRLLENNRKLDHVWILALPFEFLGGNQGAIYNALVSMPPRTPPMLASVQLQTDLYKTLGTIFRPLLTRKL
jgi:hypothetical protein